MGGERGVEVDLPDGSGHAEEVEEEEDDGTVGLIQPLLDEDANSVLSFSVTGHVPTTGD